MYVCVAVALLEDTPHVIRTNRIKGREGREVQQETPSLILIHTHYIPR